MKINTTHHGLRSFFHNRTYLRVMQLKIFIEFKVYLLGVHNAGLLYILYHGYVEFFHSLNYGLFLGNKKPVLNTGF